MTNDLTHRMPWEPAPRTTEETVALLQADFAYALRHTAVVVHSTREELRMIVNTKRGQIIPRGECRLSDGGTFEFQDIGMPQVGAAEMTVQDLMTKIWETTRTLGLELV